MIVQDPDSVDAKITDYFGSSNNNNDERKTENNQTNPISKSNTASKMQHGGDVEMNEESLNNAEKMDYLDELNDDDDTDLAMMELNY